jgi:hypothetical protein
VRRLPLGETGRLVAGLGDRLHQLVHRDRVLVVQQELRQVLERARFKVIELTGDDGKSTGRILVDEDTKSWHLFAAGLPALPAGKMYQLWYVTADQKRIAAGSFNTDANNIRRLKVTTPADQPEPAGATVTDDQGKICLSMKRP